MAEEKGSNARSFGGGRSRMPPRQTTVRERFGALHNLPPFLAMVWRASRWMTAATLMLRLIRGLLPIATLFIGKLIIDQVVGLVGLPERPADFDAWRSSGLLRPLGLLLLAEFGLAIASDLLGRLVSLVDGLLSDRVSNGASIRLMEHAATLDLEDFEDAGFQDRLDRARMQTSGRMSLMGQLFGQAQDIVTVISFAVGLVLYAPWLMVLLAVALVPAFLGDPPPGWSARATWRSR